MGTPLLFVLGKPPPLEVGGVAAERPGETGDKDEDMDEGGEAPEELLLGGGGDGEEKVPGLGSGRAALEWKICGCCVKVCERVMAGVGDRARCGCGCGSGRGERALDST